MIRVTVELLPGGFGPAIHLGTAYIANDGTGTPTQGNYNVQLSPRGNPKCVWRRGRLLRYRRKSLHPWYLIGRAITAALEEANK